MAYILFCVLFPSRPDSQPATIRCIFFLDSSVLQNKPKEVVRKKKTSYYKTGIGRQSDWRTNKQTNIIDIILFFIE